ncbi:MAG: glycosyltransferase family 39 protein [Kiritimatiellia bacterium]
MRQLSTWERLFLLLLGCWLLAAAVVVDIEYYDGLDSVANARFYTGQSPEYVATRGPLIGLLLIPAEAVRSGFGLHPLETRPHHLTLALLHFAGVFLTWRILRQRFGDRAAVLAACAAALPVFIFFSYAPFISHDILPGILLLGMLAAADDWRREGRAASWWMVTGLGCAAAMIKFTFGLFWVAVMLAQGVAALLDREIDARSRLNRFLLLGFGALAGAVVTWLVMCASLGAVFPDTPFLERAARQLQYLGSQAHDKSRPEPLWVYLRNLPAYGPLAMLLVLPGLWLSLRGNRLQQSAAVAWIVLVAAFHVMHLRQVRYLAFLGPVTALVILPVWLRLRANRVAWTAGLLGIAANWIPGLPYNCFGESTRIFREDFYRHSPIRALLKPLDIARAEMEKAFPFYHDGDLRRPVLINWRMLSFMPARDTPLVGDKYHDLFHFGDHHLAALYGYGPGEVIRFEGASLPAIQTARWPDRAAMILSSPGGAIAINPTDGTRRPADYRDELAHLTLTRSVFPFQIRPDLAATNLAGKVIRTESGLRDGVDTVAFGGEGIQDLLNSQFEGLQLEVAGAAAPLPAYLTTDRRILVPKLKLGDPGNAFPATQFRFFQVQTSYRPGDRAW